MITFRTLVAMLIIASAASAQSNPGSALFRSSGAGELRLPHDLIGSTRPAVGDLNGDGHADIYAPAHWDWVYRVQTGRLLLGDGRGGFTDVTSTHMPTDEALLSTRPLIGDVDGDGDQDIVVLCGFWFSDASPFQWGVHPPTTLFRNRLYLNDGTGRFTVAPKSALGTRAHNSRTGVLVDVDSDGDLDLFVCNQGGQERNTGWVSEHHNRLYLNDGTGQFVEAAAGSVPADGRGEFACTVGDVDGDGDPDLCLAQDGSSQVPPRLTVLENDGSGAFQSVVVASGESFRSVNVLDVDGDGVDELLTTVASRQAGQFTLFRTFAHRATGFVETTAAAIPGRRALLRESISAAGRPDILFGVFPDPLVIADLDGDGDDDALLQTQTGCHALVSSGAGVLELQTPFGDAIETYAHRAPGNATLYAYGFWLAAGDFDGDGVGDAVGLGRTDAKIYLTRVRDDGRIQVEDAIGGLVTAGLGVDAGFGLGDIDGDGHVDIVAPRLITSRAVDDSVDRLTLVALGDGFGRFAVADSSYRPRIAWNESLGRIGFELVDVDGDGDLDAIGQIHNPAFELRLWLNDGSGRFGTIQPSVIAAGFTGGKELEAADVDGDGALDLFVLDSSLRRPAVVTLLLGDGRGNFRAAPNPPRTATAVWTDLELGDVDADGDLDVVLAGHVTDFQPSSVTQTTLWLNDGAGNFVDATAQLPTDAQPTASTTLADVDGDGDLDLLLANRGFLRSIQPWGTIPGEVNQLWLNDGAGRFSPASARLPNDAHHTRRLIARDFDRDGDVDLFAVQSAPQMGDVATRRFWKIPLWTGGLQTGTSLSPIRCAYYRNDGTGRFQRATDDVVPEDAFYVLDTDVVDLDHDGDDDLVFLASAPVNRLFSFENRAIDLELVQSPRIGSSMTVRPWLLPFGPAGVCVVVVSAGTVLQPVPGIGTLRLDPATALVLGTVGFAASGPQPTLPVAIPADPGLIGFELFLQGAGFTGQRVLLTSAVAATVSR